LAANRPRVRLSKRWFTGFSGSKLLFWAEKGGRLSNLEQPDEKSPGTTSQSDVPDSTASAKTGQKKLTYKDQRELDSLPALIDRLESEKVAFEEKMSAPGFYQQAHDATQVIIDQLAQVQGQLDQTYARWQELDS
jgi:ATP-binding cassette subfamily F protein uup